jgi:excisionase family DNA binding protein
MRVLQNPIGSSGPDTRLSSDPGSHDPTGHGTTTPSGADEQDQDEVLDVRAAARLLLVGRNTIYDLVNRNEIPHRRLGKQIRFSRAAIMRWFSSWSSQGAKERQ